MNEPKESENSLNGTSVDLPGNSSSEQPHKDDESHNDQPYKADKPTGKPHKIDESHMGQSHKVDESYTRQPHKVDKSHTGQSHKVDESHTGQPHKADKSHTGQPQNIDESHAAQPHTVDASQNTVHSVGWNNPDGESETSSNYPLADVPVESMPGIPETMSDEYILTPAPMEDLPGVYDVHEPWFTTEEPEIGEDQDVRNTDSLPPLDGHTAGSKEGEMHDRHADDTAEPKALKVVDFVKNTDNIEQQGAEKPNQRKGSRKKTMSKSFSAKRKSTLRTQKAVDGELKFVYNPATHTCCDRSPDRCCVLFGYYLILYTTLCAIAAFLFYGFTAVSKYGDKPTWNLYDQGQHPYLYNPGLDTVPKGGFYQQTVEFDPANVYTWIKYVRSIGQYLNEYPFQAYRGSYCDRTLKGSTQICNVTRDALEDCSGIYDETFGYSLGQPCLVVKMNKIIGWQPDLFSSNPNQDLINKTRFDRNYATLTCEQDNPKLSDCPPNCLGEIRYLPKKSFHKNCYPYCGKNSSLSTASQFQMVKFMNITKNVSFRVFCRIWTKNIIVNKQRQQGSKTFYLHVKG